MKTQEVAQAINQLGFKLLNQLRQEGGENSTVFISPASISLALTMLLNGAGGDTRSQLAKGLGIAEERLDQTNAVIRELVLDMEQSDPDAKLEIANALFGRLGYNFQPDFIDNNITNFRALVQPLDFACDPDGSLQSINGWCAEKTHGKIPGILDRVDPSAAMYLLNAVYFKGMWAAPFDADYTKDRAFYTLDGGSKMHPTMQDHNNYWQYKEHDTFQHLLLSYGEGRFAMDVLLPSPETSLHSLLASLDSDSFQTRVSQLRSTKGSVRLPKFKLEYSTTLNDALQSLGMGIAFDPTSSDFSNMVPAPDKVAVDEVRHTTFIEVTEECTEAAAVTSIGMSFCTAFGGDELYFNFDANRPFLVAIRDTVSGTLLFLGAIVEPQ